MVLAGLLSVYMFRPVLGFAEVVFPTSHSFVKFTDFESKLLKIKWNCVASVQYLGHSSFSCSFSFPRVSFHVEQLTFDTEN